MAPARHARKPEPFRRRRILRRMTMASFLTDLAGAYPLVSLLLVLVYPPGNRIWGGDPLRVFGRKIGSHSAAVFLVLAVGVPLGWASAALGGALMPAFFLIWRAIIISNDWATPDNPREVALAFVRHMIPAWLTAAAIGGGGLIGYEPPFEWSLVGLLALSATLCTALAVRFTHTEERLAAELIADRITREECAVAIKKANAKTELYQGLAFWAAVFAWTLSRGVAL